VVSATLAGRRRGVRRGLGVAAAVLLAAAGLFIGYLRMARVFPTNSDGASIALQAWDVLHGNVLLRGWTVADVSFYGAEMFAQSLAEAVLGLSAEAVHVVAALTYTLLVLAVAAVAAGRSGGIEAAVRIGVAVALVLAPSPGAYQTLFTGPDHTGTALPVLVTWLVLERRLAGRYLPVIVALLLAWAQIGDPLVTYLAVLPLVLVAGWRAVRSGAHPWWRRLSGPDGHLVLAAVVSYGLATGFGYGVRALGGYQMTAAPIAFSPAADLRSRAARTARNVVHLFGGYLPERHGAFSVAVGALHLAGLAIVAVAVAVALYRAVRRPAAGPIVDALLAVGILVNLGAYLVSTLGTSLQNEREIVAVLPLGAALAGRVWGPWLRAAWSTRVAVAVLASLVCVSLGVQSATAEGRPGNAVGTQLAPWLLANGYPYGLGTYWLANSVTLASHGRVHVAPVIGAGQVIRDDWESRVEWYDPARHDARFILLDRRTSPPDVIARLTEEFGRPARVYEFNAATVALLYDHNLLPVLPHA
jgi:hypothetical protein